jgi:hypothetical protein
VEWEKGGIYTFWVEDKSPYRIVRWKREGGQLIDTEAHLIKSDRNEYWNLNKGSPKEKLRVLGLVPRGPRMP